MKTSTRALSLAVVSCVALAACLPDVTVRDTNGSSKFSDETLKKIAEQQGAAPPASWAAYVGASPSYYSDFVVEAGSSMTLEYQDRFGGETTCYRYGPGTYNVAGYGRGGVQVPCDDEDEDEDDDQDLDDEDPSQDAEQSGSDTAATQDPGVLNTVRTAVTSTPGTIITAAVVGGVLYEHIEDNREGDGEPISP